MSNNDFHSKENHSFPTNDKREHRDDNMIISQSLPIPEYKMGWIIGKHGTYINQLSKKSGATITISDSKSKEFGTVWKYVQITGTHSITAIVCVITHILTVIFLLKPPLLLI